MSLPMSKVLKKVGSWHRVKGPLNRFLGLFALKGGLKRCEGLIIFKILTLTDEAFSTSLLFGNFV